MIGVNFLHEAAMRIADLVGPSIRLEPEDLKGLLECHSALA